MDVKIFGERNTATTALKMLIERNSLSRVVPSIARELDPNFDQAMHSFGDTLEDQRLREAYVDRIFRSTRPRFAWKHASTKFEDASDFKNCLVVFSVRHPASWLLALHRRPYRALQPTPVDFEKFVVTQWQTTWRDRMGQRAITPIDLYSEKLRSYITFASQITNMGAAVVTIRHEVTATNQYSAYNILRPLLSSPVADPIIATTSTNDPAKSIKFYKSYYGENKWRAEIGNGALKKINELFDWTVARLFDYFPI